MDKRDSWKRTDEKETDLLELLHGLCGQWKQIVLCAAVCAVFLGGYGWMKGRSVSAADESATSQGEILTDAEEQAVADAVRLADEIKGLEEYLDSSVLMQLDPYHKNRYVMLYSIDHAQRQHLASITESYLNFIQNGGAADVLQKSAGRNKKIDKNCLAELITAYQKTYSSPYQIALDSTQDGGVLAETVFYVEVTGRDAASAKQMGMDIQAALEKYSASVRENTGSHRLVNVSSAESVTADSSLQAQQHDKKTSLSACKSNLKTMTEAFSREQKAAFQEAAGTKDRMEQEEEKENSSGSIWVSAVKYVLLGFAGGVFAYSSIFLCWYIFSDTLKSAEEIKRLYVFPLYGEILLEKQGKCRDGAACEKQKDSSERGTAQVLNRIRLACGRHGIKRLYAVSDYPLSIREKECLDSIAAQLQAWGISMECTENASAETDVWDDLADAGNVLMVCRKGTTTHRMIDDAMSFYEENGMAVAGAAVFVVNG